MWCSLYSTSLIDHRGEPGCFLKIFPFIFTEEYRVDFSENTTARTPLKPSRRKCRQWSHRIPSENLLLYEGKISSCSFHILLVLKRPRFLKSGFLSILNPTGARDISCSRSSQSIRICGLSCHKSERTPRSTPIRGKQTSKDRAHRLVDFSQILTRVSCRCLTNFNHRSEGEN